eukprot:36114-Prorocentrum_minimum.AAC.2
MGVREAVHRRRQLSDALPQPPRRLLAGGPWPRRRRDGALRGSTVSGAQTSQNEVRMPTLRPDYTL